MPLPSSSAAPKSGKSALTRQDLNSWFAAGCKPEKDWRIGTEHEIFVFDLATKNPAPYSGDASICAIFREMATFGWQPAYENGNAIAMTRAGASLSLEPGGQLELSGAPLKTLHETEQELSSHFKELRHVGEKLGLGFLPVGVHPTWNLAQMPHMPKARFDAMGNYLQNIGTRSREIMYLTCTVQTNLDFSSEEDMATKMCVSMALQPLAIALWANSPFLEGERTDYQSMRSHFWTQTDTKRTGFLPEVMNKDFCFDNYTDFALKAPMTMAVKDDEIISTPWQAFADFIGGSLPELPDQKATLEDWENHLGTLLPEVRLKQFIEMRGSVCGSPEMILAHPAFWTGLLYDSTTLAQAHAWVKDWREGDITALFEQARKHGLNGQGINGESIKTMAEKALKLSRQGLEARALGEEVYLAPLAGILQSGKTPAELLIDTTEAHPDKDPAVLFDAFKL
mgnify:CR=1 FL=1